MASLTQTVRMSSFVGHGVVAVAAFRRNAPAEPHRRLQLREALWLLWLIVLGLCPDLDYVIPALSSERWGGLRVSHSILGALILPAVTLVAILFSSMTRQAQRVFEATMAGLSHIVLDFLVGVHPLPLLWPLVDTEFRLQHGLLPSAGSIQLSNIYFWRNLAIELLIIVPLLLVVRLRSHPKRFSIIPALIVVGLVALAISISFERPTG